MFLLAPFGSMRVMAWLRQLQELVPERVDWLAMRSVAIKPLLLLALTSGAFAQAVTKSAIARQRPIRG